LLYAIANRILDSDLKRENWESRMFQFYAGDLYEIFPKVQTTFYANEVVTGNCKATNAGVELRKSGIHTFNISLHFAC